MVSQEPARVCLQYDAGLHTSLVVEHKHLPDLSLTCEAFLAWSVFVQ